MCTVKETAQLYKKWTSKLAVNQAWAGVDADL